MKSKNKKTLVLDVATWRCGLEARSRKIRMGRGSTALKNADGFMCCLGQFIPQLSPEIPQDKILGIGCPSTIGERIPLLTRKNVLGNLTDSDFSSKAIDINDSDKTIPQKIKGLRELCKKHGYKLIVKNKHLIQ